MDLLSRVSNGVAYLDANVLIYAVERIPEFAEQIAPLFTAIHEGRLPDAIHAATALATGCTHLLTNDPHFRSLEGIDVVVIADAIG